MAEEKQSFEQAMARLEKIVAALDGGEAPLEESLTLFEEGAGLVKQCALQLEQAEQRVTKLMTTKEGELREVPFEEGI